MEVAGPQAAATLEAIGLAGAALDDGAKASAKHLCVRAATIYSGTSETQRNVIAHQILANQ
jgi:alkylation response protein AidB-like acyl-CoA dehydrogenase